MGVTETESLEEPGAAPVGEGFITGEQDLADLVERVSLAASMPELLLLDSAADGVQAPLGDPDDVKAVCHLAGVVQQPGHPGAVGIGQTKREHENLIGVLVATVRCPSERALHQTSLRPQDQEGLPA